MTTSAAARAQRRSRRPDVEAPANRTSPAGLGGRRSGANLRCRPACGEDVSLPASSCSSAPPSPSRGGRLPASAGCGDLWVTAFACPALAGDKPIL